MTSRNGASPQSKHCNPPIPSHSRISQLVPPEYGGTLRRGKIGTHWQTGVIFASPWRFAAALMPRLFGKNPRSHHKGATGRVRTGDQRLPILCHCQLGQDIPLSFGFTPRLVHWHSSSPDPTCQVASCLLRLRPSAANFHTGRLGSRSLSLAFRVCVLC